MIVKILLGRWKEKINNSELHTSNFLPPDTDYKTSPHLSTSTECQRKIFTLELICAIFNSINSEKLRQLPVIVPERGNSQGCARLVDQLSNRNYTR